MQDLRIHIKNVVCQRCITAVRKIFERLDIPFNEVLLGEVILKEPIEAEKLKLLEIELENVGFEIIMDRDQKLVNSIKSIIIKEVYSANLSNTKLSQLLASRLNFDYSHITHQFTESEGQSIQRYYNAVRIERAKELLDYDELGIAEIADQLGYSTPAYLSTSFKSATGLTPSAYRKRDHRDRKTLDSV